MLGIQHIIDVDNPIGTFIPLPVVMPMQLKKKCCKKYKKKKGKRCKSCPEN